jgi:hypothetical protein
MPKIPNALAIFGSDKVPGYEPMKVPKIPKVSVKVAKLSGVPKLEKMPVRKSRKKETIGEFIQRRNLETGE